MTKLAQLLGHILALDVQERPTAPESGATRPGNARTIVGRLHPRALGDDCGTMVRLTTRPAA
jgi:hypothetical protein